MVRRASCCCGQTTFSVDGEPEVHGICHCNNCKRRTGSAFGWSAYFSDTKIIDQTGETLVYTIAGDNPQDRYFCCTCGTTLYWSSAAFPGMTGIAGGCFADDPLPPPTSSCSDDGRCVWLTVPRLTSNDESA